MSNKLFDVRVMLPDVHVKVVASDESQARQFVYENLDYEMIGELSDNNFSVAQSEDVSSEYSFDANKVGFTSDFEEIERPLKKFEVRIDVSPQMFHVVAYDEDDARDVAYDADMEYHIDTSDFEVRPDIEELDESVEGYERGLYSRF